MRTLKRTWVMLSITALLISGLSGAAAATPQSQSWSSAGTYSWQVPSGVTEITVAAYGGGGGGGGAYRAGDSDDRHRGGSGGWGGKTESTIEVTAGETLTIVVGAGGAGGIGTSSKKDSARNGDPGEVSLVRRGAQQLISAAPGMGGAKGTDDKHGANGASGAGYSAGQTFGQGGAGGQTSSSSASVINGKNGSAGAVSISWTAGPTTGTVTGTVVTKGSAEAIEGATVTIGGVSGATLADGTFEIAGVPAGTHMMTIAKTGFNALTSSNVLINAGESRDLGTFAMGGVLTVKVVEQDGTTPIVGATVTVLPGVYSDPEVPRTTNNNGEAVFAVCDIDSELTANASMTGYVGAADSTTLTLCEPSTTLTISLDVFVPTVTLIVDKVGQGTTNPDVGQHNYTESQLPVQLSASPASGWRFVKWEISPSQQMQLLTLGEGEPASDVYEESDPSIYLYTDATATAHFERRATESSGGPSGVLNISVVKNDGGDVSGLPVSITGPVSSTLSTNSAGQTALGGLHSGTYTANVSISGYSSDGPATAVLASDSGSASVTITLTADIVAPPEQPEESPVDQTQLPIEDAEGSITPIDEPPVEPPAGEGEPTEPGDLPKTGASYLGTTLLGLALVAAGLGRRRSR